MKVVVSIFYLLGLIVYGQETIVEPVKVPSNYNQITRIQSSKTEQIHCKIVSVTAPHLIVAINDPDYHAKKVYKKAYDDYVTESDDGKILVIEGYPQIETAAVGQKLDLLVSEAGTIVKARYDHPVTLELWTCVNPEKVNARLQKISDQINQEIQNENNKKAVAKAQAIAQQKTNANTAALKSNQEAAAKGDAYGLLRMGERYLKGDGVEKDLAKARQYLQRAAENGSATAKDELSKLDSK